MGKSRVVALALAAFMIAPAAATAHTKTVYAGGPLKYQQNLGTASVDNFLINRVTINAGDSVTWNSDSLSNGFHTVDIPPVHGQDLSLIVPSGGLVSGVLDAAGNPFWFNGKVPNLGFNPALFASSGGNAYNGSSRVESGLPLSPVPHGFTVQFTKPGVYRYFCDVHPGMEGWVIVKPKGKPIPSDETDRRTLRREETAYAREAKHLAKTPVPAKTVDLGKAGPGGVSLLAMFPSTLKVKKNTTVLFIMPAGSREVHTATFGRADYLKPLANAFPSAQGIYASDPMHIVLTPTSHGNGFANTGALDRDKSTPLPDSNTITFTTPGTYHFECLIHTFMHGTIVVK